MLSVTLFELSVRQLGQEKIGVDIRLVVKIVSVPQRDERSLRFEALVQECLDCPHQWRVRRIQLSWYGATTQLQAGEIWELTVRLKPIETLRNPGGFDRVRWALSSGLHARGYVRQSPEPTRLADSPVWSITAMRQLMAQRLASLATANENLGLVQALTLGVRHGVQDSTWELLRQTGTAHLLAISGLHITLLAGWAYVAVRWLGALLLHRVAIFANRFPELDPRSLGLVASLLVALAYALIAGFGLPTQRAVIMLAVWVIASLRFRTLSTSSSLCLALLAVLVIHPLSVLSVGFWLSFGTVAALFYLHHGRMGGSRKDHAATWVRRLFASVPVVLQLHVLLGILLLPVTAWFFQSGSVIAPLANLFAVPWVGAVVVPLCFITLILSLLSPQLAQFPLQLTQWSIHLLLSVLDWMSEALASALTLVMPSVVVGLLTLFALVLLLLPRGLGLRWLALPLLLPALLFNVYRAPMDGFEVHVLDVGQGLAVLVFTDQQTLLFDTGGKISSELSMFEAVVMPFLHSRGRRSIDTLVVSHTDEDHAFGVTDLLRRFPDARVFSSASLADKMLSFVNDEGQVTPVQPCEAGMQWQEDEAVFTFLSPAAQDKGSDNDRSCVMLIHLGASRVLLTGDIEASSEQRLFSRLEAALADNSEEAELPLSLNLLVAPHHGSNTSSTPRLLQAFNPASVVFPAGHRNRYGFPHGDVQLRYALLGAIPYITGMRGAVSFSYNRSGVDQTPSSWWHSHRRFWHGIVNTACSERFSDQTLVLRLALLAHKGQTLCGK